MFQDTVLQNVVRQLKTGQNKSMQCIINATLTAGGVVCKVITLPDTAQVVRIYSNAALRAALTELPVSIATTATFVIGSVINASEWVTFTLDNGLTRTLQLSTSATANVTIEIY
jgi:hypothetical protein